MSKNAIPLKQASAWAKNWREKCPNNCKAFLVPTESLISAMIEMNILQENKDGSYKLNKTEDTYIRAYLGIDPKTVEGNGEKLLIVGTKKDGKGIYKDLVPERSDDFTEGANGEVYDFSQPCPKNCDEDSPLNN